MPWKKVTLTDDDIAAGGADRLQEAFWKRFSAAGGPHDAVMYGIEDVIEGHHFFFSPAAAIIAGPLLNAYTVTDCPEPDCDDIVVLVS
ncbi:MAG TPA: hypothetical protein VGI28_00525 [Stellaceae bacterium]